MNSKCLLKKSRSTNQLKALDSLYINIDIGIPKIHRPFIVLLYAQSLITNHNLIDFKTANTIHK